MDFESDQIDEVKRIYPEVQVRLFKKVCQR